MARGMLGGRRTPSSERSLFLTFCVRLAQSSLARALELNARLPWGVANMSLSGREDEIWLRPSANRCLPMNDRALALHSALKQAADNVTQNSDTAHVVGWLVSTAIGFVTARAMWRLAVPG